ncbi:MAG: type II toxin-antitoxin system PemK/MazF family toxin [Clostridiales Family XIII bacterium]|jgi:mRNA interferase MazF|nr:type II toxin-antitoxin system PemK/MazF family toxin [Clostridiales Family XIII bacterium]
MKRGEVWTLRDDGYAAKARPVVIVQSDPGEVFDSVVLCLFTTFESDNIPTRIRIAPDDKNGLLKDSYVMTEKIVTVSKNELGVRIGELQDMQMHSISAGLAAVLDIHKEDLE